MLSKLQKKYEEGQALVLVLLSLAVVLTLVLFILSRSVTDIAISSREEESIRAFSAAEAGIEKALVVGAGSAGTQIGDASYTATVSDYASGVSSFIYPLSLSSGESGTIWFVNHDTDSNIICDADHPCFSGDSIKVCWGKDGTAASLATTPAIEFILYYADVPEDYTTLKIARVALDPNSGRTSNNSFSSPDSGGCTIDGEAFAFQKTITFSDLGVPASSYGAEGGLQFGRVRMLYNTDQNHKIGFDVTSTGNVLPSQGSNIASTGSAGEANRRIEVFQGWPEAPAIFESTVFSTTGLSK